MNIKKGPIFALIILLALVVPVFFVVWAMDFFWAAHLFFNVSYLDFDFALYSV